MTTPLGCSDARFTVQTPDRPILGGTDPNSRNKWKRYTDITGGSEPFDRLCANATGWPSLRVLDITAKGQEAIDHILGLDMIQNRLNMQISSSGYPVQFRVLEIDSETLDLGLVAELSIRYNLNPDAFLWQPAKGLSDGDIFPPVLYFPTIGIHDQTSMVGERKLGLNPVMMFCHNISPGAASHLTCLFELGDSEENESEDQASSTRSERFLRRKFKAWAQSFGDASRVVFNQKVDEESGRRKSTMATSNSGHYTYNDLELPGGIDVACRLYLHLDDEHQIATLITYKGQNSGAPDDGIAYIQHTIDSIEQFDWLRAANGHEEDDLYLHFPMAFLRLALDELISGWMFALGHYDQMLRAMRAYSATEPVLIQEKLGRLISRLSQISVEFSTLKSFAWNLQKLHNEFSVGVSPQLQKRNNLYWDIVLRKFEMGVQQQITLEDRASVTSQLLLSQVATRDSNSMRVIAIATTLFLPAAFVASFFGSNLYEFTIYEKDITVWLFFVVTVPLTSFTMVLILSKWPYIVWVKCLQRLGLKPKHPSF
ncbi:hypothetical protein TWF694_007147 [Orbilia ellipsospora]|uniref:Uncharacterized protein n=1 Tax=Orbilia ellipsospora TaxID=2528407 RepID=A0AAV9XGV7_9PEZI